LLRVQYARRWSRYAAHNARCSARFAASNSILTHTWTGARNTRVSYQWGAMGCEGEEGSGTRTWKRRRASAINIANVQTKRSIAEMYTRAIKAAISPIRLASWPTCLLKRAVAPFRARQRAKRRGFRPHDRRRDNANGGWREREKARVRARVRRAESGRFRGRRFMASASERRGCAWRHITIIHFVNSATPRHNGFRVRIKSEQLYSLWRGVARIQIPLDPSRRHRHAEGSYYFPRGSRSSHPQASRVHMLRPCVATWETARLPIAASSRKLSALARLERACRKFLHRDSILDEKPSNGSARLVALITEYAHTRGSSHPSIRCLLKILFYRACLRAQEEKWVGRESELQFTIIFREI